MKKEDFARLKVLVVESQASMRTMLRQLLRDFGVGQVHDAASIEAGWEKFNDLRPDVTLIDWNPEFDGLELLRMIRTDAGSCFPQAPVVMLSAFGEARQVYQALDAGMTEYVVKPASPSKLRARVVAALDVTRPFIRTEEFVGPCRRRHAMAFKGAEQRHPANANLEGGAESAAPTQAA